MRIQLLKSVRTVRREPSTHLIQKGKGNNPANLESKTHACTAVEDSTITVPHYWPTKITRKMHIEEWEKALEEANIKTKYANVINGFKHGFSQGIPTHTLKPRKPY
jgi:hypothetical protein